MQPRVLIVDDDAEMRAALNAVFSADGYGCQLAADASVALDAFDHQTFDIVVSDVVMNGMSGLDLLDRIKRTHPAVPFIVITAAGDIRQAVDAIKRGAFEYVVKPCGAAELRRVVASALDGRRLPGESVRASQPPPAAEIPQIVGDGPAMQAMDAVIDLVARSSAPVLVTGETGTGKELVARTIHARSARGRGPFIAVNMSAIPEHLLEAEIFGHVRGAFTGAVQPRKGLFAAAHGGTLLLDEIGDMAMGLQAKLLRVLQSGDVRPVGSERTHRVDVRVIASTHHDLANLVEAGRFREDLYFRLDVLPVFVPALRNRREDIPALVEHFLGEAGRRTPLSPVRAIGPDALRTLSEASWPGNVRELESAIERAVVFGLGETIDASHFSKMGSATRGSEWPCRDDDPWSLRRMNRAYADWMVGKAGGDKRRAAEMLEIDLSTLYRWQRAPRD